MVWKWLSENETTFTAQHTSAANVGQRNFQSNTYSVMFPDHIDMVTKMETWDIVIYILCKSQSPSYFVGFLIIIYCCCRIAWFDN